ncbi:MAG: polymerase sigma factor SigW [Bacteroidota bacterium]
MAVAQLHTINDEALVAAYTTEGNREALGVLYTRYKHLVYGVCYKYLANAAASEDAVSAIFEKLQTSLASQNINVFKAWLYTVAKNHCLMQLRSNKTKPTTLVDDFSGLLMEKDESLHLALEKEIKLNTMHEALHNLDERQRTCIQLFYLENKSYADIQQQTGFTFAEVKSFIQNGKRNLKIGIEKQIG